MNKKVKFLAFVLTVLLAAPVLFGGCGYKAIFGVYNYNDGLTAVMGGDGNTVQLNLFMPINNEGDAEEIYNTFYDLADFCFSVKTEKSAGGYEISKEQTAAGEVKHVLISLDALYDWTIGGSGDYAEGFLFDNYSLTLANPLYSSDGLGRLHSLLQGSIAGYPTAEPTLLYPAYRRAKVEGGSVVAFKGEYYAQWGQGQAGSSQFKYTVKFFAVTGWYAIAVLVSVLVIILILNFAKKRKEIPPQTEPVAISDINEIFTGFGGGVEDKFGEGK